MIQEQIRLLGPSLWDSPEFPALGRAGRRPRWRDHSCELPSPLEPWLHLQGQRWQHGLVGGTERGRARAGLAHAPASCCPHGGTGRAGTAVPRCACVSGWDSRAWAHGPGGSAPPRLRGLSQERNLSGSQGPVGRPGRETTWGSGHLLAQAQPPGGPREGLTRQPWFLKRRGPVLRLPRATSASGSNICWGRVGGAPAVQAPWERGEGRWSDTGGGPLHGEQGGGPGGAHPSTRSLSVRLPPTSPRGPGAAGWPWPFDQTLVLGPICCLSPQCEGRGHPISVTAARSL